MNSSSQLRGVAHDVDNLCSPAAAIPCSGGGADGIGAAAIIGCSSSSRGVTTCGNVSVPYPFGISPGCYWPGLDLTCDRSQHPPRLLLGDGTFRVTGISINDTTVRVMRTGSIINTTGDSISESWNASFGGGFTEYGYLLSSRNELVVFGCNVVAMLLADGTGVQAPGSIGGCASLCSKLYSSGGNFLIDSNDVSGPIAGQCTGISGCCKSSVTVGNPPSKVQVKRIYTGADTVMENCLPVNVFVTETGWIDQLDWSVIDVDEVEEAPFLLQWSVTQDVPQQQQQSILDDDPIPCPDDVGRKLCKSEHSVCWTADPAPGYICNCKDGYDGNPYLAGAGGCQDVDECKLPSEESKCFGECTNTVGSYYCRCPHETFGNSGFYGGCAGRINSSTADVPLPTVAQAPIGLPKCNTTCGDVRVPYPFGVIPGCHMPGFKLTCNTSYNPPRLYLRSDDTLEVVDISLLDATVRIIRHIRSFDFSSQDISSFDLTRAFADTNTTIIGYFDLPKVDEPYMLPTDRNEFILSGCNVEATLYGDYTNGSSITTNNIISSCESTCSSSLVIGNRGAVSPVPTHTDGGYYCSSRDGCCHVPILAGSTPRNLEFQRLNLDSSRQYEPTSTVAFVSEEGLTELWHMILPRTDMSSSNYMAGNDVLSLIIGLSVAIPLALLLLVLGIISILRKIKQRKVQVLKQMYFKLNRGQLLQQLVSQKADIAERMIIPVDELAKATNNFDKARELGGGGHGTVYKGILSDLHVVAIKKSKITVQEEIDEFINEVAILSQMNHKNVVRLIGCCLETEVPLLVYEFISNGTLYHHLHVEGHRSLSWSNRLRIATEIATSLAYLHSEVSIPIIHRDIKSSNILLDDTLTSKIADFGASRYIPIDKTGLTTRVQGTIGYLDPMYFYTNRLTEKSDVYSFGVILVELLSRKKPFSYLSIEGDGLVSHFLNLFAEGSLVQIIDPQVIEEGGEEVQEVATLAASCINFRGEERPTMRQVEHTLEGFWGSKRYKKDDMVTPEFENGGQRSEESSRRYSLEQEMMMSTRVPR
ncbi:unnamed protein product [Urochloa decumbens]|uniref:Protein kinase domain-containing protein n=1 Tax=Urochloa decumbens TaxID=240449 RepID=A0ABC9AMY4_9POAL